MLRGKSNAANTRSSRKLARLLRSKLSGEAKQCIFRSTYHNIEELVEKLKSIRGVSEKYPTCVHISALVLFFVIRTVASFEIVPI